MFKKPFQLSLSHNLSGADRKKLRKQLQKEFYEVFSNDDQLLDLILPVKNGNVTYAKFASPSRMQVYLLDDVPMLLDTSGKGDFVPTVFALWKLPNLLPIVHLKHPAVSQYIVGGADLMLPGVNIDSLPIVEQGALVSIGVIGNNCPIAVGRMLLSTEKALERLTAGAGKGKLVELLHHYRDQLWQLNERGHAPNDGFQTDIVLPLEFSQTTTTEDQSESVELQESQPSSSNNNNKSNTDDEFNKQIEDIELKEELTVDQEGDGIKGGGEDVQSSSTSVSIENENQQKQLPEVDMDDTLITSFLQALHKVIKDDQLPMNSSTLWGHILSVQPPGSRLDIKKTSFKKLGKFLQAQSQTGLITSREDKHTHENYLQSVNRDHEIYDNFRPYKMPKSQPSNSNQPQSSQNIQNDQKLIIEELLKPSKELSPIFKCMNKSVENLYSSKEAAEIAFNYIQQNELDKKISDPRRVLLDPIMSDALFKGLIKKGQIYPTDIEKAELRQQFLKRMLTQWRIRRGEVEVIVKKALQSVQISLEKRQGNKKVSRIIGVEPFLLDPQQLGEVFKKKFACTANVNELEGKKKEFEIMVQGSFVDQIQQYLRQNCGIPQKFVQVKGK